MTEKDNEIFWHADDASALTQARAGTELSRAVFARALSISEKQLTQLEEGGSSAFYSERIKYQMGARILGYFEIQTVQQKTTQDEPAAIKVLSEPVKNEALEQFDTIYENNHKSLATTQPTTHEGFQLRNGYVLGAAIVAAVSLGVAYTPDGLLSSQTQPTPVVSPAQQTVTPAPAPTVQSAPTDDQDAPTEVLADATPAQPEQAKPLNCDWSGSPTPLKPISATRPADRILLVARTDIELCLKDGIGQEKVIKLVAGERQTFHGSGSTWHVYSPQMDYLQVFFQGFHVSIPKQTTKFIKLEPYF